MPTNVNDKIKALNPADRKKVEDRTAELIAEEMSLRELRKAHNMAQERIAEILGIGQEGVSRLEKRSDLLISTLRSYVEAMGGNLSLIAEFPGQAPVSLSGLASMETKPAKAVRKHAASTQGGRKPRAAHAGGAHS